MSTENKAIIRRYYEELWNEGALEVADDVIAADCVIHDPVNPGMRGPEGVKELVASYRDAFPDARFSMEDQIAKGDKVVTRWSARAAHKGELNGIPPTGEQVSVTGVDIHRLANGKIEEAWSHWDTLGLMQQIGAIPSPEEE